MSEPERPWWRMKRWVTAAAVASVVAAGYLYPLSGGLAMYAVGRGWLNRATFDAFYAPALAVHRRLGPHRADEDPGPIRLWFGAYEEDFLPHWYDLGRRAASD